MIEDPLGPEPEELEAGGNAALALVSHMKRIGSAQTLFEILDGGTLWTITVEAKSLGSGKPN